ncbi:TPA: transposase, partial [Escherichia coli]
AQMKVNEKKSAVARPWERKFPGYSVTWHKQAKLKIALTSVNRLKEKVRSLTTGNRSKSVKATINALTPVLRGWISYFRLTEVRGALEELDGWIKRKQAVTRDLKAIYQAPTEEAGQQVLEAIYQAPTEEAGQQVLEAFAAARDSRYPQISRSRQANWPNLATFFAYPTEIRKMLYTTNAIGSLNSVIRHAIKKRNVFPTNDSVKKVVWLAIQSASQKWTMPLKDWRMAMSRFIIGFGDRMDGHY